MNKNYRSVWNLKTQTWVAVSENTATKSKKSTLSSSSKISYFIKNSVLALSTLVASQSVLANDCVELGTTNPISPTVNSDQIECLQGLIGEFNGLGGNDNVIMINQDGDLTIDNNITFADGNDRLQIRHAFTEHTTSAVATAIISMGAGDDILGISGNANFDFNSRINLGAGSDEFEATRSVTLRGDVHGNEGNDKFFIGNTNTGDEGNIIIHSDVFGDEGDDTFIFNNAGVDIKGAVRGGADSDQFRFQLGTVSNVTGDDGNDSFDILGTFNFQNPSFKIDGGSGNDNIRLLGVNGEMVAANFTNIESIQIGEEFSSSSDNISSVTFTGDTLSLKQPIGFAWRPGVRINPNNELKFKSQFFSILGGEGIDNAGILNLRGTLPGKVLFLDGNYIGSDGSSILLNTKLGNDNSVTDLFIITGNTSGKSKIFVNNVGGTGAKTINGINLIEVQGNSNAVFTLGAPVQVGSWEYFLFKSGKNWNLESSGGGEGNQITPVPTPTPTPSPSSTPTPTPTPKIYRPGVAGYLQAAQAGFDQNANLIGTLEQRQASINNTGDIWGRVIADKSSHKTSTFGYEQSSQTLQFGKDIIDTKSGTGNQTKAGITVGLGQQSSSYSDQIRAFTSTGINTGASETTEFALGAYYTQRNEVNPYMDLQAHIIGSRTKFNDVYDGSAKQSGFGVALSAELGKDIALGNTGLDITPQAQAVYQNHSYSGFNDAISDVAKQSAESLRVRAGITLQSNKAKIKADDKTPATHWNASLNLWQEVLDNPNRTIAGSVVNPDNSQKPWLELGLGVNHTINETSSLNAQISHKRSISGNQHSGNAVNLAYRVKW